MELELTPGPETGTAASVAAEAAVLAAVRRWLDLDADPGRVDGFLAGFGLLAPLVAARHGLRVPGSVDGFETAVQRVLGQQVSLAAARTFGSRLVAAFGGTGLDGLRAFPAAEHLAAARPPALQAAVRITPSRARTISALAGAVAGGLVLDSDADPGRADALFHLWTSAAYGAVPPGP